MTHQPHFELRFIRRRKRKYRKNCARNIIDKLYCIKMSLPYCKVHVVWNHGFCSQNDLDYVLGLKNQGTYSEKATMADSLVVVAVNYSKLVQAAGGWRLTGISIPDSWNYSNYPPAKGLDCSLEMAGAEKSCGCLYEDRRFRPFFDLPLFFN